jgi:glycosyltransferase involved in cell wall biosynthesis
LRIAVVSPFLDRRHGAERCIVEQIERICREPDVEVHIYAQQIQDLEVVADDAGRHSKEASDKPVWHRLPVLPGPHLCNFVWWFLTNTFLRWYHRRFRSLLYDVVYSPGINCPDADAIVVHVVFHEFFRHVRQNLRLARNPVRSWPQTIHRNLYYRMIMFLENRIYSNPKLRLAAVSGLTARELSATAKRQDIVVIPNAVDANKFSPGERLRRRQAARDDFHFDDSDFVLLLLGNGWKNKGLDILLDAVGLCRQLPLKLLIVGRDDRAPFERQIRRLELAASVTFADPSPDVLQFYAAADAYVGPSLHDSFALPPLEAMACGLAVITSSQNGGAQVITEGMDGFVLADPEDRSRLAKLIADLCRQPELCSKIGSNAAVTAKSYDWERNAGETFGFLRSAIGGKAAP